MLIEIFKSIWLCVGLILLVIFLLHTVSQSIDAIYILAKVVFENLDYIITTCLDLHYLSTGFIDVWEMKMCTCHEFIDGRILINITYRSS